MESLFVYTFVCVYNDDIVYQLEILRRLAVNRNAEFTRIGSCCFLFGRSLYAFGQTFCGRTAFTSIRILLGFDYQSPHYNVHDHKNYDRSYDYFPFICCQRYHALPESYFSAEYRTGDVVFLVSQLDQLDKLAQTSFHRGFGRYEPW